MSNARQEDADLRPLLPRRNFNLGSWFGRRWFSFRRDADGVQGVHGDVESSDGSHYSRNEGQVAVQPAPEGETSTPPPTPPPTPPNTPPELTGDADVASVEIRAEEERPSGSAESSWMAAGGPSRLDSFQRFLETVRRGSSSDSPSSSSSNEPNLGAGQEKFCLICLEPLSQEDFESGRAMVLQCRCKGDAALRHKECAQKWVDVKGSRTCDVCRAPIENLEEPPPRSEAGSHSPSDELADAARGPFPNANDVFDCIRMTWVITIVCILFFGFKITAALIIGLVVAVVYTWSCQLMRCAHQQAEHAATRGVQREHVAGFDVERSPHQLHVPAIVVV